MRAVFLCGVVAALLSTSAIAQSDYVVLRKQVQMWSGPHDDMRPEIEGDVIAVDPSGVTLKGGTVVPAEGAKVRKGAHANFICEQIGQGRPPSMRGCTLKRSCMPKKPTKNGSVKLW